MLLLIAEPNLYHASSCMCNNVLSCHLISRQLYVLSMCAASFSIVAESSHSIYVFGKAFHSVAFPFC